MKKPDITKLQEKGVEDGAICQICPFHFIYSTANIHRCDGCEIGDKDGNQ